jgi:hypothetical protein
MEQYLNVTLVKIEEDRVIVVNGEEYLLVDPSALNGGSTTYSPPEKVKVTDLKEAIVQILEETPGLQASEIRTFLKSEYNMEPTDSQLRSTLQRMRVADRLVVEGVKRLARWYAAETEEG